MVLGGPYLTSSHLRGFDNYKYNSMDTSPLSKYVFHPFWNTVVEFVPKWVAPNVLTFSGWILLMAIFAMFSYYDWDYYVTSNDLGLVLEPIPPIVWLLSTIFHFSAHTLDGIDGKQARRTGSSTPLGELFDHGIDSMACILLPVCLMSAFGRGENQWGGSVYDAFFPCLSVLAGFYLSHWEKYVTGVLYLPWLYDFVQTACALGYLLTYVYGVEVWQFYVVGTVKSSLVVKLLLIAGFLGSIPMTLWNIYEHYNTENERKKRGFLASLEPWSPFIMMASVWTVWAYFSPTEILEREPRLFLFTMGVHFSNVACRLIIAQMSNQRCDLSNMLVLPVLLGLCLSLGLPQYERTAFYVICVIINLGQLHYAVSIVTELCDHFNIYCFSLVKRGKDKQ